MDKKRLAVFGVMLIAVIIGLALLLPKMDKKFPTQSGKPIVAVSTFPLYEASRAVAGETLEIRPIVPFGSDAHMFSPNPVQIAEISGAALFLYNGAGFETWAQSLKNTLPQTTKVIDMSAHVTLLKDKDHGGYDPHYWLNIDNMIKMTQTIEHEFSALFPNNARIYHQNALLYVAKLQNLKSDYQAGLQECKNRTLISNHNAFGYLAYANRLQNVSVIGLSSDEQPSANTIAQVATLIKNHGIKTIFFEELVNDNISQTLAKETGATAQSLQPLENISENELKSHQTYESIMRSNLAKLTQAMECR
ncbi:MAG: zinc ABC transporter substrate-binding protein [Sulfuricurvum sp.]|nr:zinc ABC transporter substrate-binding protein [Sulfuricurvum sp.]